MTAQTSEPTVQTIRYSIQSVVRMKRCQTGGNPINNTKGGISNAQTILSHHGSCDGS